MPKNSLIDPNQPPAREHYLDRNYDDFNLWLDYWYQQSLLESLKPKSILEIGKGTGMLSVIMKKKGYRYVTLDVDKKLKPDILGNVTKIPLKSKSFDISCAFEVLEHIPFQEFPKALTELGRVSKKYVVISLPYASLYISIAIQFFYANFLKPIFKYLNIKPFEPSYLNIAIPMFWLDREGMIKAHYWEIGRKNIPFLK